MAPSVKLVLGSFAFVVFWVLAVFPSVPFLPIGRTAGSLLGAMLMVLFQVITPEQAYAAVDLPILGLLFGTMVVSIYLERADMFKYLGKLLSWKSKGPKDLLCRICVISAISSAFFTNDTCCVVLTEFVLKLARQQNIPPHPFLLALASSANIGSSATPIGNPQNLVIAVQSKISFVEFLFGIFPAMVVGMVVNAVILLGMYWKLLSAHKDEEDVSSEVVCENDVISHRFSPAKMSHSQEGASLKQWDFQNSQNFNNSQASTNLRSRGNISEISSIHSSPSLNSNTEHIDGSPVDWKNSREDAQNTKLDLSRRNSVSADVQNTKLDLSRRNSVSADAQNTKLDLFRRNSVSAEEFGNSCSLSSKKSFSIISADDEPDVPHKWKQYLWKASVYIVTLGMLASLLAGLNMSWTALMAALALVVLDFKDARPCLEKVSYSLLVFFCGMFITVDGFNKTGIPSALWDFVEPYAGIDHVRGIAILAIVILVLSNVASNVPTVLLLGVQVAASAAAISPASEKKSWLILAWSSTVAGNLSLLGSAANLIVCEQARSAQHYGYNLSFLSHLKFGLPSTILITAIGLVFIRG